MNPAFWARWVLSTFTLLVFGVGVGCPVLGKDILLTGGRVLDVGQGKLVEAQILISGHRIAEIGSKVENFPDDTTIIELNGAVVMPGLIDLHSHLLLHPYNEATWNDQVLKESLELRTIRGTVHARKTLEAGFTTIRDLGTEGAGFADVALRDTINSGMIPGPRVLAVTQALVTTGGYGPSGFDPRFNLPKGAQVADGVDGVRRGALSDSGSVRSDGDLFRLEARRSRTATDPDRQTFDAKCDRKRRHDRLRQRCRRVCPRRERP